MDERRRSGRLGTGPDGLKVRVDGPHGTQHLVARDLSREGLFVEAPKLFPVGANLECRLELPGGAERISFVAEVRHANNAYRAAGGAGPFKGVGVRFIRIGAEEHARLVRYLDAEA
jgi:hypothetical protein